MCEAKMTVPANIPTGAGVPSPWRGSAAGSGSRQRARTGAAPCLTHPPPSLRGDRRPGPRSAGAAAHAAPGLCGGRRRLMCTSLPRRSAGAGADGRTPRRLPLARERAGEAVPLAAAAGSGASAGTPDSAAPDGTRARLWLASRGPLARERGQRQALRRQRKGRLLVPGESSGLARGVHCRHALRTLRPPLAPALRAANSGRPSALSPSPPGEFKV